MKKEMEKVAIIKCENYNQKKIDKAIKKLLELLDFDKTKYKDILIKPNVLGYYKENLEAIITHPSIVRTLLKIFKNAKVGESSFTDTENNLRKVGYWKFKPIVLEEKKLSKIRDEKAKILKHFYLPKIIKEADLIINVPKLKTHTLVKITGAIKNLYGCIPGGVKQLYHRKAKGEEKFSNLLVDIYQNIKPKLNIMDAVIAMEGEGPSSGKPRKVGLLLASRNAISLDIVAAKLMGYNPKDILVIREAIKRGLGSYNVEIIGDLKEIPNLKFQKPSRFKRAMVKTILLGMTKEKIVVDEDKCVKCGICARKCPAKAIILKPYPIINSKKCIRCFCCIEVCPHHALHLKDNTLRKIAKVVKEMKKKQ
jgi:uncharacterized protein (DUF362 family)